MAPGYHRSDLQGMRDPKCVICVAGKQSVAVINHIRRITVVQHINKRMLTTATERIAHQPKEGTPLKIPASLVFAFLPFAVLAQDASTAPAGCQEDHFVSMQAGILAQSSQSTHEEGDAALNGDRILGGAAEPTGENNTAVLSTNGYGH
jgi:hypothetical protein